MYRILVSSCLIWLCTISVQAQSTVQPAYDLPYHWLDRFDILYDTPLQLHTGVKRYWRKDMVDMVYALDSLYPVTSTIEEYQRQWLIDQNTEWALNGPTKFNRKAYIDSTETFYTLEDPTVAYRTPSKSNRPFLKHFYKTPGQLIEVDKNDFFLRVNPLLNFRLGKDRYDDNHLFENQRGISIRGGIDQKVYFHTDVLESQAYYPKYVRQFSGKFNVPGVGFKKGYNSSLFGIENGVDFLLANAYVGASISKHVNIELGHGRHFIGNGMRSLFLSDFSTDYFYVKLNTRIWKFHYQNIFGELQRFEDKMSGDSLIPKKYFATHYLNFKVTPSIEVGLFETVVFARENQFELQYLNPIILYRTVEGSIGSPDNVILGIDLKANMGHRASFYSQFVLDEFKVSELFSGNGWWANKFGIQTGLKYLDLFGVNQLDIQLEYNAVRPYTYSHRSIAHYSHYQQSLAHPLGANFREGLMKVYYQPGPRWSLVGRLMYMVTGEDNNEINWGSNILLPYDNPARSYGNHIGQGIETKITTLGLDISYELKQGLYLDLFLQSRNKDSALEALDQKSQYIGSGIRWNLGRRWQEF